MNCIRFFYQFLGDLHKLTGSSMQKIITLAFGAPINHHQYRKLQDQDTSLSI